MSDTPDTNPASSAETTGDWPGRHRWPAAGPAARRARVMIPVSELTAHPGNVREDLELTRRVLRLDRPRGRAGPAAGHPGRGAGTGSSKGTGGWPRPSRPGWTRCPATWTPAGPGMKPGQYLDMLLANSATYRRNFAPVEEAAALFAAHEAGASRTELRKATGPEGRGDQDRAARRPGSPRRPGRPPGT